MRKDNCNMMDQQDQDDVSLSSSQKQQIWFTCINKNCNKSQKDCCYKCLLEGQNHYNCDVISNENEQQQQQSESKQDHNTKQLLNQVESLINKLKINIDRLLTKGFNSMIKQSRLGNEGTIDKLKYTIELLKDINMKQSDTNDEGDEQQDKSMLIGDIWSDFEQWVELDQQNTQSQNQSSVIEGMDDLNQSLSKSILSMQDQSSILYRGDVSSISNSSHSSKRKKISLIKKPIQSNQQHNKMIDEASSESNNNINSSNILSSSLQSSISKSANNSQKSISNSSRQQQYSQQQQYKSIPLQDFKYRDQKQYPVDSQYIETFCLFESNPNINNSDMMENTDQNNDRSQKQYNSNSNNINNAKKNYFLITRYDKQTMQIYDLQNMIVLRHIQFTNDNEEIYFKQISQSEVIIFSPNNNYLWIQNIFDEKKFSQIDFKFNIDCLECDIEQSLIFISHQLGKLSVWCAQNQQPIISGIKIHSKKTNLMDYKDGRLVTCCDSGSVKEFSFSRNNPQLLQKQIYRKELISDDQIEQISHIKIINDDTVMIHLSNEFFEIFQNGVKVKNDDTLEQLTCLSDMKIYDGRFGILRYQEDENIACIYDFVNFESKKNIKLYKPEQTIIGAYYINNYLLLLFENQYIIKYF